MSFAENLKTLREQKGMKQETLADRLDVSRQAVSKWENGSAYPEMDKLFEIGKLFDCPIDTLATGRVMVDGSAKKAVDGHYSAFARMVAGGVSLLIFAATAPILAEAYHLREAFGGFVFMCALLVAVPMFVYAGMRHESFEKEMALPDLYTEDEKRINDKLFATRIASGVGIIFVGILSVLGINWLYGEGEFYSNIAGATFLVFVSVAVYLFIYAGITRSKFETAAQKREKETKGHKLANKISGVIMLSATAIYLYMGFAHGGFGTYWYVFPIGGILCAIVHVVLGKE